MITRPITRPVTSPIARAVNNPFGSGNVWSPLALFRGGEQGFWYDTNDLSTLFQDSAGTTPVTAADQPVGLRLDTRLGLVRGPELVDLAAITPTGSMWAFSGGAWTVTGTPNTNYTLSAPVSVGVFYDCSLTVQSVSGGPLEVRDGGATGPILATITTAGTRRLKYMASAGALTLRANAAGMQASISGWSVRELPGNHALQPTAASRPMLRDTPRRVDYDVVDDSLGITFPAALGSDCTVARAVPGVGAQIITAQTIGNSYTLNVDSCADLIIDRALTDSETANLTRFLNQRAGV